MRIVYLSHRVPYPPNKGEKIRTFHQLEYLVNKGHEIALFTPLASPNEQGFLAQLEERLGIKTFSSMKPGKFSLLKGLLTRQPLSMVNFYSRKLQAQLNGYLEKNLVDALVCTSSSMAEYVFRYQTANTAESRLPAKIMDFMDLDSDKWRQYCEINHSPLKLLYKREANLVANLELAIHNDFDASIFISAAETSLFEKRTQCSDKIFAIGNGLDTHAFAPPETPRTFNDPVLLFTGVMDYLPNVDAVCWFVNSAWSQIVSRFPQAKLYIAGMNPVSKVKNLAKHPGVVVTGFVEDISEYFDKANIFIAPFRIARGVQNKILQAFACGLPTITTPVGAEGISCNHGQHVLIARTADEIIAHIEWIMNNPESATAMGTEAMELVKTKYSWEGELSKLEEILTQISCQHSSS